MSERPRLCPNCRQLNGPGEAKCFRCGNSLRLSALSSGPWAKLRELESPATKLLVGLCVLNFLVMVVWGRQFPIGFIGPGPSPATLIAVGGISGHLGPTMEQWRMLSAVFVHLGAFHLLMNMSALLWLGRTIEAAMGSWRMVWIFVLSGVGGFLVSCLYYGLTSPPTAGASGAIFGLVGAQIAEMRHSRDPRLREVFLQYLAYAAAFALLMRVNNAAHLGGFLIGYVLAEGLIRIPRRVAWDRIGNPVAAVLIVLSISSQVAALVSPYTRAVAAFRVKAR